MSAPTNAAEDLLTCAGCGVHTTKALVTDAGYRCPRCELELAHLDTAPNGTIRGVLGWLRAPGELLEDRYRVSKLLGRGGFAVTYLVEDELLKGKRRALKEVPEILFDEGEADILSRIDHPAVPDITDRSTRDGMVRLILEFGGGRSLETVREEEGGRISLARLAPWVEQLCDVLGYLHEQVPPIVHRDLKPENILLDDRDRVMIIDFGIAKEGGEDNVTRTIARAVSHGFSPPEQALGTGTDQRSDVYSLGATVYALLTGQPPSAAHERVSGQEIEAPSALNPEVGPELEAVLLRSMSLNILQRYESIRDFGEAFAASCGGPAVTTRSTAARTVSIDQIAVSMPSTGARPATGPAPVAPLHGATATSAAAARGRPGPAVWIGAGIVLLGVLAAWFALRDAAAPTKQVSGATAPLATATMTAPGPVRPPVIPIPRAAVLSPPNSNLGGSALAAFDKERVPDPEPLAPPEPQRVSRKTAPPVPLSSPPEPEPAAAASESGWGQMKTTIKRTN